KGRCTASKKQMNGSRKRDGKNLSAKHWLARPAVLSQKLLSWGPPDQNVSFTGPKNRFCLARSALGGGSSAVRHYLDKSVAPFPLWAQAVEWSASSSPAARAPRAATPPRRRAAI